MTRRTKPPRELYHDDIKWIPKKYYNSLHADLDKAIRALEFYCRGDHIENEDSENRKLEFTETYHYYDNIGRLILIEKGDKAREVLEKVKDNKCK